MKTIVPIQSHHYPWDLLLLADPNRSLVEVYLKDSMVLGNVEHGEVRGVIVIAPLSPVSWEIKNVAVSPRYQGKGIGTFLLRTALDLCEERGAQEVWIGTGNSSLNQLGLYQKIGFRMVEIVKDFFSEKYTEPIVENGITCRDMVRLVLKFTVRACE